MPTGSVNFVSWEEQLINEEKGNREVHYFLKNAYGDAILAIVGTEKSLRHMLYVVSDDFLQSYGSQTFVSASTKWRARRDVIDWLVSTVSQYHPLRSISTALRSRKRSNGESSKLQLCIPADVSRIARILKSEASEIVWLGHAWTCCKQLRHYPALCRNGTTIAVHSFVFVMAEGESHYIGYVEDMYENKTELKRVKVRWFYHHSELEAVIPKLDPDPREIFMTSHVQSVSAESIDGLAIVLIPKHYNNCIASVSSRTLLGRIHVCSRQIVDNKIKSFSLTKLRGYANQGILSSLDCFQVAKHRIKANKTNGEENDHSTDNHAIRSDIEKSELGKRKRKYRPPPRKLKIKFPNGKSRSIELVGPGPWNQNRASFKVGEKIEVLSQDSGMRGCWFRCEVIEVSKKRLKVKYVDVLDAEELCNLEEWVSACQVAAADKLGMRSMCRLTIRPWPSEDSSDRSFEIGTPVDAWWSDGWWEGVIVGFGISGADDDTFKVYFPGETWTLALQRKDLRISRDWIGEQWVDIAAKKDVLTCISSSIIETDKLEAVNEAELKLSSTKSSNNGKESVDVAAANLLKPLCIIDVDKEEVYTVGGGGGIAGKQD